MSFLKQILTPFIEFEEDNKKQPAKNPAPSPVKPEAASANTPGENENVQHPLFTTSNDDLYKPATQPPAYSPSGTMTTPLPEHIQYFERLIDEANAKNPLFQGTDYKEFVDSKIDIDDIQDEAIKYKTAYNVLKSTGLTKEKLLSTGQEYLQLIGRDLNTFQSTHAQQYNKEVRQKEQQIQKKAEELQLLFQKMNTLKAEMNALTQEVDVTKEKLNTVKNSFLLAGENKQKEIQAELQKIAQYF